MTVAFEEWGEKPLMSINKDKVLKHHEMLGKEHGEAYANLAMRLLRSLFNFPAGQDKKSCISDYYVDPIGWLIKEKCIFLARQNQLELEICTSRLGHSYLKAPHCSFQVNLKNLIEKKPRR